MAADTLKPVEGSAPVQQSQIPNRGRDGGWTLSRFIRRVILRRESHSEIVNRMQREEERNRRKSLKAQLQSRSRLYAHLIPLKLADLNICYRYRKTAGGRERVQYVRFTKAKFDRDAIHLKVDFRAGKSPRGIGVAQLMDPLVLETLSIACLQRVTCAYSPEIGFWYIVELNEGSKGIPTHVGWAEMIKSRPSSADKMSIPIGMSKGRAVHWESLNRMYSILVAGTIGAGKSNYLNVILCTLLGYNKPSTLQLALVDLKGGIELNFYKKVPHLMEIPEPKAHTKKRKVQGMGDDGNIEEHDEIVMDDGELEQRPKVRAIVSKREHVPDLLRYILKVGEARLEQIDRREVKGRKVKNITEYNWSMPPSQRMPHIVLAIDEWADVRLERSLGSQCESLLSNIASRYRAAGIHVILCTQVPNRAVISTNIKEVLRARVAFSVPDVTGSILIVGDSSAQNLHPSGRAIAVHASWREEIQTPYMPPETIDARVLAAVDGKLLSDEDLERQAITPLEIWEYSRDNLGFSLDVDRLFEGLRQRGCTRAEIDAIVVDAQDTVVMVGQTAYKVMRRTAHGPRTLQAVSEILEEAQQEPIEEPTTQAEETPLEPPPPPPDLAQQIVEWAVRENGGAMPVKRLLDVIHAPQHLIKSVLPRLDGNLFVVDEKTYRVFPGDKATQTPRRAILEPVPEPILGYSESPETPIEQPYSDYSEPAAPSSEPETRHHESSETQEVPAHSVDTDDTIDTMSTGN